MDEVSQVVQITGLAGLSLLVMLAIARLAIKHRLFPRLSRNQGFVLFALLFVGLFAVALLFGEKARMGPSASRELRVPELNDANSKLSQGAVEVKNERQKPAALHRLAVNQRRKNVTSGSAKQSAHPTAAYTATSNGQSGGITAGYIGTINQTVPTPGGNR